MKYEEYMRSSQTQLPFVVVYNNVKVTVSKIDFNVKTTTKDKVPKDIIRKKLFSTKNLDLLLWEDLGIRFIHKKDKYRGKRIGLHCSHLSHIYLTRCSGLDMYNWLEVPNNTGLVTKMFHEKDIVENGQAVYLPFVSLPFPSNVNEDTSLGFECDDFLPNPKKRRMLYNLVVHMDTSALDTYFSKKKLLQYTLGTKTCFGLSIFTQNSSNPRENQWVKVQAATAHQPNSILGQILVEGKENLVKFTLQYFTITAEIVNQLVIGYDPAVEKLARVGRLQLISSLVPGILKPFGSVFFHPGVSFKRIWSAVFAAIEADNVKYLKAAIALDKSKQLNLRDDRGITALGLSVLKNNVELVRVLLRARAKVDQPSWGNETALGLALQVGDSNGIIRELVQAGAKVTGRDLTGKSLKEQIKAKGIDV